MPLGILYWLAWILFVIFGGFGVWRADVNGRWYGGAGWLALCAMLFIAGWKMFGPLVQGQ